MTDTLVFIPAWNEAESLPGVLEEPKKDLLAPFASELLYRTRHGRKESRTAFARTHHGRSVASSSSNDEPRARALPSPASMFFLVDTRKRRPRREPDQLPLWLAVLSVLIVIGVVGTGFVGVIALFAAVLVLFDRALPAVLKGGLHDHRQ